MTTAIQRVEAVLAKIEGEVVADLKDGWNELEPAAAALGKTILGQILTAGEAYITSGGNFADFLASIMSQLPADAKAIESIIAGALSAQVAKLQAAAPATPAAT